jgi:hypothetical protein
MALETATYVPELTETNPIGASDPKSQGDDHLRLIKKVLLNTFGAFVGTAGAPKSVTLTEDELNDCAQKLAAATIAGLWDFTTDPTLNSDLIGRNKLPQNIQNGNYEFVLADAGDHVYKASGAGNTLTIPANASVVFELGDILTVVNQSGNSVSIAITTDTMTLEGDGATGTRTLADDGMASFMKVTTTSWLAIGGASLS